MLTAGIDIGHLVKTIVSLAASTWDMYSDVSLGLYYYHPKNVTRYLENSTVIPDNCVPCPESNSTRMFECLEEDRCKPLAVYLRHPLVLPLELLKALFCVAGHLAFMMLKKKKFAAIPALPSSFGFLSHSCVCHTCDKSLHKERIHGILEHNDSSG